MNQDPGKWSRESTHILKMNMAVRVIANLHFFGVIEEQENSKTFERQTRSERCAGTLKTC